MADKYHDLDSKVKYESISQAFTLLDSGDLETGTLTMKMTAEYAAPAGDVAQGATSMDVAAGAKFATGQAIVIYDTASPTHIEKKTITVSSNTLSWTGGLTYAYPAATSRISVGYSCSLTLLAPTDPRVVIDSICLRIARTVARNTSTNAYSRVYVDQIDAGHLIFDNTIAADGTSYASTDAANSTAIASYLLPLVTGLGAAHTFYIVCWSDNGDATASLIQLYENAGTISSTTYPAPNNKAWHLNFTGYLTHSASHARAGTGTAASQYIQQNTAGVQTNGSGSIYNNLLVNGGFAVHYWLTGIAAGDIIYATAIYLILRSES